jgi:hypothetical protein
MKFAINDNDFTSLSYFKTSIKEVYPDSTISIIREDNFYSDGFNDYDIIISEIDYLNDGFFPFLGKAKETNIPIIIVSNETSERLIVECLRHGALDYISKRNLKHGQFPRILKRVLLQTNQNDEAAYKKLNDEILSSFLEEKNEVIKHQLSRGSLSNKDTSLEDGQKYFFIFVFLQLNLLQGMNDGEQKLSYYYDKIINKFLVIAKKYGSSFSLKKGNGGFFSFTGFTYYQALLCAMEIHASMNLINVTALEENKTVGANLGVDCGMTTYNRNIGNISSDALNLSAHMAIKNSLRNGIMITKSVFNNIGIRAQKYFIKTDDFENTEVFYFKNITHKS